MEAAVTWSETGAALQRLEGLLKCSLCHQSMIEPCSIGKCDHNFCRGCILRALSGRNSGCPKCGYPAWIKDLKPNWQLDNLIHLSGVLREQIASLPLRSSSPRRETCKEPFPQEIKKEDVVSGEKVEAANQPPESSNPCVFKKPLVREDMIRRRLKHLTNHRHHHHQLQKASPDSQSRVGNGERKGEGASKGEHENCAFRETPVDDKQGEGVSVLNERLFGQPKTARRKLVDQVAAIPSVCSEFPYSPLVTKTRNYAKLDSTGKMKRLQRAGGVALPVRQPNVVRPGRKRSHQQLKLDSFVKPTEPTNTEKKSNDSLYGEAPVPPPTPSSSQARTMRRNARGETPLHMASIKGDLSAVRMLLSQGADPNAQDNAGWTPLHEACNHGHKEVATALLGCGALVNVPGFGNDTPLHDAVANGHVGIAQLLLERGANPDLRNRSGRMPRDLAHTEAMKTVFVQAAASSHPYLLVSPNAIRSPNSSPAISVQPTKRVLLPTSLRGYQKTKVEELAGVLSASVVHSYSPEVTHVITSANKSGCSPRTLKLLCGIAQGKWVVDIHWILACLKEHQWVDEVAFEIRGLIVAGLEVTSEAPRKGRENTTLKVPGLFDGCKFHFAGSFPPSQVSVQDLSYLVKLAGGEVLAREPKTTSSEKVFPYHARPHSKASNWSTFVVQSPGLCGTRTSCSGGCVSPSWILDCLSHFELMDLPLES